MRASGRCAAGGGGWPLCEFADSDGAASRTILVHLNRNALYLGNLKIKFFISFLTI